MQEPTMIPIGVYKAHTRLLAIAVVIQPIAAIVAYYWGN